MAFGYKNTFWNALRVERGWKLKEVAEALGLNTQTVGSYMTGQAMPKDNVIKMFCELFGVDTIKGTSEFTKAHREWDAEYKRVYRLPQNKSEDDAHVQEVLAVAEEFNKKVEQKTAEPKKTVEPKEAETKPIDYSLLETADKVMEVLYTRRTLDYRDFVNCYKEILNGADIHKAIYAKVDYDTYNMVDRILNS